MVGPRAGREAVRVAREEGQLSERRACGLTGMNRGSWRYQRKERHEAALRVRLRELAGERPRFGYRRLHRMLRREKENGRAKWVVNHKRVYRLYREEGLAMRQRKSKRFRAEARVPFISLSTGPSGRESSAANIFGIRFSDRPSNRRAGMDATMGPGASRTDRMPQVPSGSV